MCSVYGYPLVGAGVAAGVVLGAVNALGIRRMTGRAVATEATKRAMAGASMTRLGLITGGVFVLLLVDRHAGFGSLVGLALFQAVLLVNSAKVLLRQLRREAGL